ncbi:MAG: sigma-70 family RNA polymerase sigma factor [Planctomycetota bacterium]|nr:sigma-70 family RNA polymerase sigma factor [Planctomycetota bacterium]
MNLRDLEANFERFRRAGDVRALGKAFDEAAPRLLAVARHLAANRDEAEDLLQATFLAAIEKRESWYAARPLLPWLLGILANEARRQRTRRVVRAEVEAIEVSDDRGPEQPARERELAGAVELALERLPEKYAGVVRRHLVDGRGAEEIASEFGLSLGNARVRLHRGLRMLRGAMPPGFAGIGAILWSRWTGPKAVRKSVVEFAAQKLGVLAPTAGLSTAALVALFVAPAALAVPLMLRGDDMAVESNSELASEAVASLEPAPAVVAQPETEPVEPLRSSAAVASALQGLERIQGRLLLPDGTPASGATVELKKFTSNFELAATQPPPANFEVPPPVQADADGRFEFAFDAPPALSFYLNARSPGCVTASWRWEQLAPDSSLDLGTVQLEAATDLRVRLVDPAGEPLGLDWNLHASAEVTPKPNGRVDVRVGAAHDAAAPFTVLSGLPARQVKLSAQHTSGPTATSKTVALSLGAVATHDLVYSGPDLRRRVIVNANPTLHVPTAVRAEHVRVQRPSGEWLATTATPGRFSEFFVDGLEPGEYLVRIDDPNYEPFEFAGAVPGKTVRTRLKGSARIRVSIFDQNGALHAGSFELAITRYQGSQFGSTQPVLYLGAPPPVGGLFEGVPPGSYRFSVRIEGRDAREVEVAGLAPGETRDVVVSFAPATALEGRVLDTDGVTPLADIVVQLTDGPLAGHAKGRGASVYTPHGRMPSLRRATRTDASGTFRFESVEPGTWTVRARFGAWLVADLTHSLPSNESWELRRPPSGSLRGRLLAPANADLSRASLEVTPLDGPAIEWFPWFPPQPSTLGADGTFDIGGLPLGQVQVVLSVGVPTGSDGLWQAFGTQLGALQVSEGLGAEHVLDARTVYPGELIVRVRIDGVATDLGHVSAEPLGDDATARLGGIRPGEPRSIVYGAPRGWRWQHPEQEVLAPAERREFTLDITTHEREVVVLDATTNAPVPDIRLSWRTGPDYDDTDDDPEDLQRSCAAADAQGRLRVRLPEGPVRFVSLSGGTFTPATLVWSSGSAPVVLLRTAP